MAHDEKVRALVRRYYVFDRFTLEQAAQKAEVSFGTARRWKAQALNKGDDWDKARDVHIMAGGEVNMISQGLLAGFILQYRTTMDELQQNTELSAKDKVMLLAALADSFTKMTAASKRILPEVSELAVAMRTVELFGEYIHQHHSALMEPFIDALSGFGQTLNEEFKK
ncbi:DUF1804 family protein [Avibacterium paragallinarum]|uniref:DNA-binding protein n=1 Tax=Avibacterium paragallinarum TaxID=728 RepID=A0AAE5WIG6_AVIPA|nr:DUF1804 family protein [Avibacterium paragallinarum]MEE3607556.1 DUF1804 family protein [Avibacterium paragallinarum]MEE3620068.1 DUF1804 family protein [Avibacterium paragallinarum]MEE3667752.1 DUF1804 family protein [Avibacterium paragallinarum]MEE3679980.1 DUF1804 family protein [Avibacterium paragallinarum]MEE4384885.1 DUF1804 family protein [Avibacterium paragallinarum]